MSLRVWFVLLLGHLPLGAATIECETLAITGGQVRQDPGYSAGGAMRVALDHASNGDVIRIPLPQALGIGKHHLRLRVRFEPADTYADSFTLALGASAERFMATDCPDPGASDFRVWALSAGLEAPAAALLITLNRPASAEAKSEAIILDSLREDACRDPVFIETVRPNKVLYAPREQATCAITLFNAGPAAETRILRAIEVVDLDVEREVARQELAIPAHGPITARLAWNVGLEQYGRELRIETLGPSGEVADRQSEAFNVADNVWKVAVRAPHGPHMTDPDSVHCPYKSEQSWHDFLAQLAERIHEGYGNFSEMFAWAPDDAFDMTPTQARWISGQGCYQHSRSRIIELNHVYNEQGVWPITYAKSAASGPPCFEFMRRHPELGLTRYQCQFDQQKVRDWDTQVPGKEKTIFYDWMSLVLNIVDPRVVDLAITEILDSADMFGWRGARYDDHYTLWGKPSDAISTRNMQRIFDLGSKRNPGFTWGFNYLTMGTTCVWPGTPLVDVPWTQRPAAQGLIEDPHEPRWETMPAVYPELSIAAANHAFFMNEQARGAQAGTYTQYARLLVHESRFIRALGGEYGPIPFDARPASAFDAIFPDLLRLACGAHTYGDMWQNQRFRRFVTRYSELLYGEQLTPLRDVESQLTVGATPGVWWHCFAYTWKHQDRQRVLVHLLTIPAVDRINQNRSGMVCKLTATVAYHGAGTVVRAWELSPFSDGFVHPLVIQANQVASADFHLWDLVLLEISGGGP